MVIITNVSYPPESASDMAKRFLETLPIPDFMTRRGPYFTATLKNGIMGLSVYEIEKSRIAEGSEFLGNYMTAFFGVPGFKYEVKTYYNVDEALKMIGMG